MTLVTLADIEAAADLLAGRIVRTPLVPVSGSDPTRPLLVKPENLQVSGAFKIRGALNAVARLEPEVRAKGVVTHSSGNHAQALAYAARSYDVPATIVMPDVTPMVKIAATKAHGAEVVLVPAAERETRALELVAEHGFTLVPPYDHVDIIAGQGTIGPEIVADVGAGVETATVLVPVSGGGLVSGVATAIKALRPNFRVIAVEPELADDLAESLRVGRRVSHPLEQTYRTIADGLRAPSVGVLPWEHIRKYVDEVRTVDEDAIRAAMRLLATNARLVAEPSGAVATAAYLTYGDELPEGPVVAVISGGNVEPTLLASVLGEGER